MTIKQNDPVMAGSENFDIGETFCGAMEIIADQILRGVKYDQTIECTITDDSKADQGIYRVSNGSANFLAYSSEKYTKNTNVYVTIPGGDYNNDKLIVGKKVTDKNEPFHYVAPFENLLDITGNLIPEEDRKNHGLVANRPAVYYAVADGLTEQEFKQNYNNYFTYSVDNNNSGIYVRCTGASTFDPTEEYYVCHTDGMVKKIFDLNNLNEDYGYSDFTRLGIRASFSAWLNEYHCISGNYGIALKVTFKETNNVETENKDLKTYERVMYLQCEDMIGNPYLFESYYQQEKLFDISSLGSIVRIEGYFFQDKNFYDNKNNLIPYLETSFVDIEGPAGMLWPNLFVEDIYVSIGYDINEYEGEFVRIFTLDPMSYTTSVTNGDDEQLKALNRKNIQLLWYHDTEDGKYPMTSASSDNFEIRWYRYVLGQPSADEYSGVSWVTEGNKKFDSNVSFQRESGDLKGRDFSITLDPDITYTNEDIKAIILYGKAPGFYPYEKVTAQEFNENPSEFWIPNPNEYKIAIVTLEMYNMGPERYYYIDDATKKYVQCTENDPYSATRAYWIVDESNYIQCTSEDTWQENATYYYAESDTRQIFRSNVLTFKNQVEVPSKATMDAIQALSLVCKDIKDGVIYDSYGNYLIYNELNDLIDKSQANIERVVGCQLKIEDANQNLGKASSITWKFPIGNTMIIPKEKHEPSYAKVLGLTSLGDPEKKEYLNYYTYNEEEDKYYQCTQNSVFDESIAYYVVDQYFAVQTYTKEQIQEQIELYGMPVFSYYINKRFDLSRTNNYISCTMNFNGINYSAAKELTFGQAGTMGSDCTFILDFDNNINAVSLHELGKKEYVITARMYDINNKEIDLNDPNAGYQIEWTWFKSPSINAGFTNGVLSNNIINYPNDNIVINSNTTLYGLNRVYLTTKETLKINELYILQATLRGFGDYSLIAYLPIPITTDREKYLFITGADRIIYLTDGSPQYYKDHYVMHKVVNQVENGDFVSTSAIFKSWGIIGQGQSTEYKEENYAYFPTIEEGQEQNKGKYLLKPALIYFDGIDTTFGAQFVDEDNQVKWTQPILIILNRYFSSMINKWDGKTLSLNNEDGTINSVAISAGRKNPDGTFSGVCIGDLRNHTNANLTNTGVYGFHNGEMSYGFKDDGTAFLGKSSKAQLMFDGNKSTITSNAYRNNKGGMMLDFDDGQIYLQGTDIGGNSTSLRGVYLDTQSETPFKIGVNFFVDWAGNLWANNATLQNATLETLTAVNGYFTGTIEGSEIFGSSVYSTEITGASIRGAEFLGGDYTLYITETSSESKDEYIVAEVYLGVQIYYCRRVDYGVDDHYESVGRLSSENAFNVKLEELKNNPEIYDGFLYTKRTLIDLDCEGAFQFIGIPSSYNQPFDPEEPDGNYPWNCPANLKTTYGQMGYLKGSTTGSDETHNIGMSAYGDHSIIFDSEKNIRLTAAEQILLESKGTKIQVKEEGEDGWHPIYAYFA